MATLIDIKKDLDFHGNFFSLIDVLKGIAVSQFHALEKKLKIFEEFMTIVESFFDLLDVAQINHPFVNSTGAPLGVIAVTSDAGLLGGLNQKVINQSRRYLKDGARMVVIGLQGKNVLHGSNIAFQSFSGILEGEEYRQAVALKEYILGEVLAGHIGAVKIIYPHALSISVQKIIELDLLPYGRGSGESAFGKETAAVSMSTAVPSADLLLESSPENLVAYVVDVWMAQKFYEIFQMSRLAEYAARIVHLEESSQKIKEIQKKLQLKYFRARHEIIDRQMRELFTSRSLFVEE